MMGGRRLAGRLVGLLTLVVLGSALWAPTAHAVDPVVAASGDIACGSNSGSASCRHKATSDILVGINPLDAVLPLGDVQYECGELSNFNNYYHPTWGRVKSKTRPSIGNHEYRVSGSTNNCLTQGSGAPGYFTYFGSSLASPLDPGCTVNCKGYYSYNLGTWHLVALNSNCSKVGGCSSGSPQYNWLKNDLANARKNCVLAYWHHPRYSSGGRQTSSVQPLWEVLYDARADIVLAGHDHTYERFAKLGRGTSAATDPVADSNGIRQWVVGVGGRNFTSWSTIRAESQVRDRSAFGVLKLTLAYNGYDWKFLPEAGKTFTDSGSTACNGAAIEPPPSADTAAPTAPTNLTAMAASATQVNLSWTAASDNVGVTGYDVYRNDVKIASTGNVTSYADTTASPGTTYTYKLTARDALGNVSAFSNTASVTTPAGGGGGTATFAPTADARVEEANPAANFGTSTSLRVDAGSDPDVETYLRFDVTGLSGTVTSAKLRLFATSGTANGPAAYLTGTSWTETGVTWSNRPARTSAATDDKASIGTNVWVEYDVTPLVTGNATYSFVLAGTSSDGVDFSSKEGVNRPQLVVTTA